MNDSSARLVSQSGPAAEAEYALEASPTTIGRDPSNDIVLLDPEISRQHAQVMMVAGRYVLEDLGSTNGTFVNGRRVAASTALRDGDVIYLGEAAIFTFHQPPDQPNGDSQHTVLRGTRPNVEGAAADPEPFEGRYEAPITDPEMATAAYRLPVDMPQPKPRPGPGSYALGFGCLALLLLATCAASFLLLDSFAPETLYCGPLEGVFRAIGLDLVCP